MAQPKRQSARASVAELNSESPFPPRGPRAHSHRLKQAIYGQLRDRIIFLELKPGEYLNETRLALELGVSRTVLREIMHWLMADGLLAAMPGQGVYVQGLDLVAIKNAYEVRVPLEGLAGGLAAQRIRPEQLKPLGDIVSRGEKAADERNYRELARLDWEFHRLIGEATRNDLLASTLMKLLLPFNRLWYMAMLDYGQIGNILQEWREILAALEERSAGKAEKALVAHMTATPSVIRPVLALDMQ